jgi:UDP-N-acetylglucosamine--N-acetylmuramyl-(pentapeptide) pyrophosphoryl-undecaprenol N-acetylglucosamine transferase
MVILLVGGGTGGHITPNLAVARELKKLQPDCRIIQVSDKGNKRFGHMAAEEPAVDRVYTIRAGKFRRYYGVPIWKQLLDFKTTLFNIRDFFYFIIGFFQSIKMLWKLTPDVVFLKGGFVGVPVGLAAALLHIPIVTHDSDAIPGLANRIVARWAQVHATGMPAETYPYPPAKTRHVGVLVSDMYELVTPQMRVAYRSALHLPQKAMVIFVTGGSSGAQRLNKAVAVVIPQLLALYADLWVVHQVGKGNMDTYGEYSHERLQVAEFLSNLHQYSGAADIVITRAGATALAEMGVQGKACIVVPNPVLTGGQQPKNAAGLITSGAALVVSEEPFKRGDTSQLLAALTDLIDHPAQRQALGKAFHEQTPLDAARQVAQLLLEA